MPYITHSADPILKDIQNKTYFNNIIPNYGNHLIKFEAVDYNNNLSTCSYNLNCIFKNKDTSNIKSKINKKKKPLINDSIKYKDEFFFESEYVTISIYDNALEDNDTISIFYNGTEIVHREMAKIKKNGVISRVIKLENFSKNSFVFKAWNVGEISPNTIKIDFYLGNVIKKRGRIKSKKPAKTIILNSKPGLSSGLWLNRK